MMKKVLALALALWAAPAVAQNSAFTNHAIPLGQGSGVVGFKPLPPSAIAGAYLQNNVAADPSWSAGSAVISCTPVAPITCSVAAGNINIGITGAALIKVDDTNVTLTLGGTPASALVTATSITVGWSGQLSVARGGTGLASGTSGGVLGFTAAGTLASSIALTANAIVLGGGAGATPVVLASLGTTTTVLHGNAAGAPTFASVALADLATQATNTVLGNATAGSASPTALAVGSCSTASSALIWTTNTGFGCNTSITSAVATATTITDDTTTNATMFPTWVTTASGNQSQKVSSTKLTFNPSTGTLFSTLLTGGAHTITSASATALAVGLNGATNPAFLVDASTASSATGLKIKSAAAAAGVALSVITSGTNENFTIDAAGSGTITFGATSTGAIIHTRATTLSAALTYGGVALSNAVTGTGNMVLSASPTLTGTLTAATITASGVLTSAGAIFQGGVTMQSAFAFQFNNATNDAASTIVNTGGAGVNIIEHRLAGVAKMTLQQGLGVGTASDPGAGMIYTNAATFMTRTKTAWTNGAGAGAGTITTAPSAGNPTKWIPVDDNGTTRYVPAW